MRKIVEIGLIAWAIGCVVTASVIVPVSAAATLLVHPGCFTATPPAAGAPAPPPLPMVLETLVPADVRFRPVRMTLPVPRTPSLTDARSVVACVWETSGAVDREGLRARVAGITTPASGATLVTIEMPDDAVRFWRFGPMQTLAVAVAFADGSFRQIGEVSLVTPVWAIVASLLATALLLWLVGRLARDRAEDDAGGMAKLVGTKRRLRPWEALFIAHDGTASISLFQMAVWTLVAVWAVLYVFLRTWNLLAMTPEVMVLLGFAGATTVLSKVIASRAPPVINDDGTMAPVPMLPASFSWRQLLETGGRFDLLKLQLLVFTLLIVLYVIYRVAREGAFPALDENFLLLMGVSNGVYLGSKLTGPTPAQVAEAQNQIADQLQKITKDMEARAAAIAARRAAIVTELAAAKAGSDAVAEARLKAEDQALDAEAKTVAANVKAKQKEREALLEQAKKVLTGQAG